MTEKQKRFCDEYLIDCNATRAYKTVYQNVKSDETAKSAASRLLTNVNVKKYIDDRMEELHNEKTCLLYTSPSPRDMRRSRMPSSA